MSPQHDPGNRALLDIVRTPAGVFAMETLQRLQPAIMRNCERGDDDLVVVTLDGADGADIWLADQRALITLVDGAVVDDARVDAIAEAMSDPARVVVVEHGGTMCSRPVETYWRSNEGTAQTGEEMLASVVRDMVENLWDSFSSLVMTHPERYDAAQVAQARIVSDLHDTITSIERSEEKA